MQAIYKICLALVFGLTLLYAFQGFYPNFISTFSNAFPPFIAGATLIFSVFALKKYSGDLKTYYSIVWPFFTLWLALWFLGETCWAIYTLILNVEVPFPSIADIFWLCGYIPLSAALLIYLRTFWSVLSKSTIGIAVGIFLSLGIPASVALMTPIMTLEEDIVAMFFNVAYVSFDIFMLFLAILGLTIFLKGSLGKSWLSINSGLLSTIVADVLFGITNAQETYYPGHPLELFFHLGYVLFLLAFYIHTKEL